MRVILNKMKGYSLLEGCSLRDTWPLVCSRNTQGCVADYKLLHTTDLIGAMSTDSLLVGIRARAGSGLQLPA
jgi:hypothetical protein